MNCGELLERALRTIGVEVIYGKPFAGIRVTVIEDDAVAELLAVAYDRVHHRCAMVHLGGGVLVRPHCGSGIGPVVLESVADISAWAETVTPHSLPCELRVNLDPEVPAPGVFSRLTAPSVDRVEPTRSMVTLIQQSARPVVLAGPGVVAENAHAALNAFAVATSTGVVNTWGAKGIFDWRSRHHLATVGLQARDFELGGMGDADLIVATGIDPDEAPDDRWRIGPVVTVAPRSLDSLAERISLPYRSIAEPQLRAGLARVTQEGWSRESGPMAPTRATLHYSQCLGAGGLVAADAGLAGYWVARTYSTTVLGSTAVAARPEPGLAAACVVVARQARPWRPALAVLDAPVDEVSQRVMEAASQLGIGIGVEVWDPDGPALNATEHLERLRELALTPIHSVAFIRTDARQLGHMLEVAGPIIAWPSLDLASDRQ